MSPSNATRMTPQRLSELWGHVENDFAAYEDRSTEDILIDLLGLIEHIEIWTEEQTLESGETVQTYVAAFSRPMVWGMFEAMSPPARTLRTALLFLLKGALASATFRAAHDGSDS